jgi:hypothetical protein
VIIDLPENRPCILFRAAPLVLLAFAVTTQAFEPVPFKAAYDVYVDGKLRMETHTGLAADGEEWLLSNDGKGIKGLARILKIRTTERSRVRWQSGRVRPQSFSHQSRVAGKDIAWSAAFDWDQATVATRHEEGASQLALDAGTLDPLSLTLALRRQLAAGMERWEVRVVDEDEIDQHVYAAAAPIEMPTALGCLLVIPVERVRENSSRYSTGWYAPGLDYMPVRIRHGKRGGREFDMRIRQLEVAGAEVTASQPCP